MNLLQRATAWGVAVIGALALGGCGSSSSPEARLPVAVNEVAPSAAVVAPVPVVPGGGSGRNALVLLSGGGTPFSNHYSQYLQAKAITAFFTRNYPSEPTWIFFGIGNRPDAAPVLADAHRIVVRDGLELDTWEAGVLPGNRAATRENFLKALREEILPTVRDGGTLYLFIGDHGELTKDEGGESAVTMWQWKRGGHRGGWSEDRQGILTVTELRQTIAAGLGRGRVVFCMTQCHSGGFHYLGVPREMSAPRSWFGSSTPEWWRTAKTASLPPLHVAGFTATDEESVAAGCVSDPDPERWAGYERFAPESVIGIDLMTDRMLGPPRFSLAAAHEAATLVDTTIDKPRATSEQYLERWAELIETRLKNELRLTEKTRRAVAAYQRAVDTGRINNAADEELRAKQEQFRRYTTRLVEQGAAARAGGTPALPFEQLLLRGTRRQLEDVIQGVGGGRGGPRRGGGNRRSVMAEARRAWNETVRPAWKNAVLARDSQLVPGAAVEFEKGLITEEEGGRNFLLPRGSDDDALLNEIYWGSTYAQPQRFDPATAEAVTRWAAERTDRIIAWAKDSLDPRVRSAAAKIDAALAPRAEPASPATRASANPLSRRTAAERVLFYRRALAAWEFLVAMDARAELERLHELIVIERAPLPSPST